MTLTSVKVHTAYQVFCLQNFYSYMIHCTPLDQNNYRITCMCQTNLFEHMPKNQLKYEETIRIFASYITSYLLREDEMQSESSTQNCPTLLHLLMHFFFHAHPKQPLLHVTTNMIMQITSYLDLL